MNCPSLERVAEWCLGEAAGTAAESFEEHYFVCELCFERAARMQRLLEQLRASLPAILTPERRERLEGAEPRLSAVHVSSGQRVQMRLGGDTRVGVWVMRAPLQGVTRVDFEARSPEGGLLFAMEDVPFDRGRGEVVLACQAHYRSLPIPAEMHVRLTAAGSSGRQALGEYILHHEFDSL